MPKLLRDDRAVQEPRERGCAAPPSLRSIRLAGLTRAPGNPTKLDCRVHGARLDRVTGQSRVLDSSRRATCQG